MKLSLTYDNLSLQAMSVISGSVFKYSGNHSIAPDVTITLSNRNTLQFTHADANGEYSFTRVYTLTTHCYLTNSTKARQITVATDNLEENFDFIGLIIYPPHNPYLKLKCFQYHFLAVIGFPLACGILYGLYKFDPKEIGNVEFARGIITYLIAAGTVGLAITLMFASVMTGGEDLEKRFNLGKQVFTSPVGVLSTVIGSYFGSATNAHSSEKTTVDPLGTTIIDFKPVPVKKDSILTVSSAVKGGFAPYQYKVVDTGCFVEGKDTSSQKPDITLQLKAIEVFRKSFSAGCRQKRQTLWWFFEGRTLIFCPGKNPLATYSLLF